MMIRMIILRRVMMDRNERYICIAFVCQYDKCMNSDSVKSMNISNKMAYLYQHI